MCLLDAFARVVAGQVKYAHTRRGARADVKPACGNRYDDRLVRDKPAGGHALPQRGKRHLHGMIFDEYLLGVPIEAPALVRRAAIFHRGRRRRFSDLPAAAQNR
ncbi:hypothetical protein [Pararobbsia alpina]|uniref:hypothetical protein n=1 Tax=Pararobbsia alpina TaxID=621374 RepID=UPI001583D66C|nr:hypothetical protein [Pararobbsia alpina]